MNPAGETQLETLAEAAAEPWLGGRLHLHQPPRGAHRAGTDAVLLASLATGGRSVAGHGVRGLDGGGSSAGGLLVDAGAGTGAVGLAALLDRPGWRAVLVEREPELAALARANVACNHLAERAEIRTVDLLAGAGARTAAGLPSGRADLVLTNPPFFEGEQHRASPVAAKAGAHTFPAGAGLDAWLRACVDLLKPGGCLGLIHRADALTRCLDALRGRFGALRLRPVHASAEAPAIRILITGIKGSRAPLVIEPPLVLHGPDGRFTAAVEALHRGVPPAQQNAMAPARTRL